MTRLATTLVLTAMLAGCTAATGDEPEDQTANLEASPARAPGQLSGEYRFSGAVRPLGRLTVDVVDTRSADAADRLEALRAAGAMCQLVISNTYRCTKMHPASTVPSASLDAIGDANRDTFARFGAVTGSPELVSEGDSLVEWRISQEGESSVGPFSWYTWRELSGGIVKIILPGQHGSSLELLVEGERLGKWDSDRTGEGRWRWHEDMAVVSLER